MFDKLEIGGMGMRNIYMRLTLNTALPDANTEKLLAIYIQNTQAEGFKQERHKILEVCDTLSYGQLTLERLFKNLIPHFITIPIP